MNVKDECHWIESPAGLPDDMRASQTSRMAACVCRRALPALIWAALMSGCAATTAQPDLMNVAQEQSTCLDLGWRTARAQEARRAALAQERRAWTLVVPVAVAGRYLMARSAGNEAAQQIAALSVQLRRNDCLQAAD